MPTRHEGGIQSYPRNYLACRARRHAWDKEHWTPITDGRGKIVGWLEQLECLRCEQPRTREYDTDLEPVTYAKIEYEDGYLASPGEPITPTLARREIVSRVTASIQHHQPRSLEV